MSVRRQELILMRWKNGDKYAVASCNIPEVVAELRKSAHRVQKEGKNGYTHMWIPWTSFTLPLRGSADVCIRCKAKLREQMEYARGISKDRNAIR